MPFPDQGVVRTRAQGGDGVMPFLRIGDDGHGHLGVPRAHPRQQVQPQLCLVAQPGDHQVRQIAGHGLHRLVGGPAGAHLQSSVRHRVLQCLSQLCVIGNQQDPGHPWYGEWTSGGVGEARAWMITYSAAAYIPMPAPQTPFQHAPWVQPFLKQAGEG
jgi:hypothetical protein